MSIKYDYGSSSKRFGVLDYKNAASAASGPFNGGMSDRLEDWMQVEGN